MRAPSDLAHLPRALRRPLKFGDPDQIRALEWLAGGDDGPPGEQDRLPDPPWIPPDSVPPLLRGKLRFGDPEQIACLRQLEADVERTSAWPVFRVWVLLSGPDGTRERVFRVASHPAIVMGAVRDVVWRENPKDELVAAVVVGPDKREGRNRETWQPTFCL